MLANASETGTYILPVLSGVIDKPVRQRLSQIDILISGGTLDAALHLAYCISNRYALRDLSRYSYLARQRRNNRDE